MEGCKREVESEMKFAGVLLTQDGNTRYSRACLQTRPSLSLVPDTIPWTRLRAYPKSLF